LYKLKKFGNNLFILFTKGNIKMKKITIFIAILSAVFAITLIFTYASESEINPSRKVLRLHIIANSDTDYDQQLKYAIRDRIVSETRELFADSNSLSETKQIANDNIEMFCSIVQLEIKQHGFDYNVSVSIGTQAFPATIYGNIMFPAGIYDSLIITIENGNGENWWCVIFPPLCFIDGINMEFADNDTIQVRFRLADFLGGNGK